MQDLKVFNKEVIPVYTTDTGEKVVVGRELHERLGIVERYSKWFDRMISYGFEKGEDYTPYQKVHPQNKQEISDHLIKFDMAKHIAMIQRSDIGFEIRQKLIELEKTVNEAPEPTIEYFAKAVLIANQMIEEKDEQIRHQEEIIGIMEPKADYFDRLMAAPGAVNTRVIAKEYGMSATAFNKLLNERGIQYKDSKYGNWLLYSKYDNKGYTQTKPFLNSYREPVNYSTKWTQRGWKFLYDFLKEKGIVPVLERMENEVQEEVFLTLVEG